MNQWIGENYFVLNVLTDRRQVTSKVIRALIFREITIELSLAQHSEDCRIKHRYSHYPAVYLYTIGSPIALRLLALAAAWGIT